MKARYWQPGEKIHCLLCPQGCQIPSGGRGVCGVRENRGGVLYSLSYGQIGALALDPMEKKPLYHFRPGEEILSFGGYGCPLACQACQNWSLSQEWQEGLHLTPEELIAKARWTQAVGLAYTYSEPLMMWEFLMDLAPQVHQAGLVNVLVSSGYINPAPLEELIPHLDAANIDLKSSDPQFYASFCQGRLEPVLETIERLVGRVHLEVTTLVLTGLNDTPGEIREIASFLSRLDPRIPFHLNRAYPAHRWQGEPTRETALHHLAEVAREKLAFVYVGNLPGGSETTCPRCGEVVIRRGPTIDLLGLEGGRCRRCQEPILGN